MIFRYGIALLLLFSVLDAKATVIQHIGNYSGWGTVTWKAMDGLNDPDDGAAAQLDFVGSSSSPGAYWGIDENYIYFRMRLDVGDTPSFSDSHFVLIDAVGDAIPDYGIVWDSRSNDPGAHGLEMSVLDTSEGTWASTRMDDLDGDAGKKLVNDINGAGRTADGYVQSTDNVGAAGDFFGTTTFLDFAVSLSYLSNYVPDLVENSDWNIQFATVANATDHNLLKADIAGGQNPDSAITASSWTTIAIPEPAAITLIISSSVLLLAWRRIAE